MPNYSQNFAGGGKNTGKNKGYSGRTSRPAAGGRAPWYRKKGNLIVLGIGLTIGLILIVGSFVGSGDSNAAALTGLGDLRPNPIGADPRAFTLTPGRFMWWLGMAVFMLIAAVAFKSIVLPRLEAKRSRAAAPAAADRAPVVGDPFSVDGAAHGHGATVVGVLGASKSSTEQQ